MPASTCIRCGLVSDFVVESGLCASCRIHSDETQPLDPEVDTATRNLVGGATASVAGGGWAGVLPPGGYRYEELLGEGGMGVVWRAVRVSTGETFAIKKLLPDSFTESGLRRFVAEARALAVVKHENVVRLYDFVPDPADPFLVMEFVPGQPLSRHLREIGPLHPDRAARLIAAAARGVQAAHDAGVIHRDLKPANLLLTPDGRVKVADFGLGKRLTEEEVVPAGAASAAGGGESPAAETVTRTDQMAGGTPGFMAPEQVDEELGRTDRLADVWGLGACLFALLTNQTPFPSGKSNLQRVLSDALVPPHEVNPAIPADLAAIVVKCLQKDPGQRYPSATALADDLDRFVDRDSTVARPKAWPARVWRRVRRTPRAVVIAVALAVIAVAVGGSLAMVPWRKDDPLTAAQKKLQAGHEVVLVDEGKLALPPSWLLADAVLTEPTADEPRLTFLSRERAMLVLMSDPGIDRYRITARVQQKDVPGDAAAAFKTRTGTVGVFWCYREGTTPLGHRGKAWAALGYNDYQPDPRSPKKSYLSYFDSGQVESPFRQPREKEQPIPEADRQAENNPDPFENKQEPNALLESVAELPGPVRTLVIDVTPEGVTVHLPSGPKSIPADEVNRRCERLEAQFRLKTNETPLGTTTWSPRMPIGVFADRTRVAVERFALQPLPPR